MWLSSKSFLCKPIPQMTKLIPVHYTPPQFFSNLLPIALSSCGHHPNPTHQTTLWHFLTSQSRELEPMKPQMASFQSVLQAEKSTTIFSHMVRKTALPFLPGPWAILLSAVGSWASTLVRKRMATTPVTLITLVPSLPTILTTISISQPRDHSRSSHPGSHDQLLKQQGHSHRCTRVKPRAATVCGVRARELEGRQDFGTGSKLIASPPPSSPPPLG